MIIVCAVLAAGGSTRMGAPKQLLELQGRPLIAGIVETCCATGCREVAVVLGAHAARIAPTYEHTRAQTLHNPNWAAGLSSSVHAAVRWAQRRSAAGLLLCACDQPLLTRAHLDALCAVFRQSRCSVSSQYQGVRGVPAVLDARLFARALNIGGDRGAGVLLRTERDVLEVPWPDGALDLDTHEQVLAWRARA